MKRWLQDLLGRGSPPTPSGDYKGIVKKLIETHRLTPNLGASDAEFSQFEKHTGLILPDTVRSFYSQTNGLIVSAVGARPGDGASWIEILPLRKIRDYQRALLANPTMLVW